MAQTPDEMARMMAVRGGKVSSTDPVAFSRDAEWEQTLEMKARSPPAAPPSY